MPNTTLHFSMQIAQYNKFYMFSLPAMISLPTGLAGSERITSASFKLASNGLEGGTLPNGYPCTPSEGGGGAMIASNYNMDYQELTLHIKWSINGG